MSGFIAGSVPDGCGVISSEGDDCIEELFSILEGGSPVGFGDAG